jgi:cytochrome c biogenesis protein CcmG/thiol:disulfide interchange protein DsbE
LPSTPSSSPDLRWRLSLRLGLLALAAVAAAVFALSQSGDSSRVELARCGRPIPRDIDRIEIGDRLPNFTLPSLDGECVRVAELRGQPLVINFWASWCNPCREEFPMLGDAREQYDDEQLEVLGITYRDIPSDSKQFAEEQEASWPLLVDDDQTVADVFGVSGLPQTFFVDREGRVRARVFSRLTERELEQEIRRTLAR